MPNFTPNYDFNLPLVGDAADQDQWGFYNNDNWSETDSLMLTAINWITRDIATSDSILVGDSKKLLLCDATVANITLTLPAAATAGDGFTVGIKRMNAGANTVTIDGDGSETIDGATTLVFGTQYQSAILVCDGTNWVTVAKDPVTVPDASTTEKGIIEISTDAEAFAGTEVNKALVPSNFVKSLLTDGYARIPGGLIIQWGQSGSFSASTAITFPLAFPTACLQAFPGGLTSAGASIPGPSASGLSTTGFTLGSGTSNSVTMRWFAVGH